jgi:hypothetical protein
MIKSGLQCTLFSNIFRNESNFVYYFSINVSAISETFKWHWRFFKALTMKSTLMRGEYDIISQKTCLLSDECAVMK